RPGACPGGRRGCRGSAPAAAASRPGRARRRPPPATPPAGRPRRAATPPPGRPRRRRNSLPTSAGSSRSCGLGPATRSASAGILVGGGPEQGAHSISARITAPQMPPRRRASTMTEPTWMYENFEPTGSAIGYRVTAKLDEVQSPFQKIEIYDSTDWGKLMLIDGAMMLTTRDNFLYHEMMSHPALFTHANPRNVVIIGGGDCGTLREVLRHPGVASAVQCDIDEQVTRMSEKYFPELCESNGDPRATLMFDDGVAYMANC